jgi:uncharacterized repeat protein (TIGR01451 family)
VTRIANTTSIADDGTNGSDPTPANNTSSDTTPLTAAPDLQIGKSDGGVTTTPDGTVAYTLSYTNTGNQDATGVVITETVPLHTSFNAGASTAGWICTPNGAAGSTCTLVIGSLPAGVSNAATFAVTVAKPMPSGVTQIVNTAVIGDDGTNGSDPTPPNNNSSDNTPVITAPGLILTKSDGGIITTPGGTVAYTLGYTNTGNIGLTGVVITETVPLHTSFNAGASTAGWVCAPNGAAGSTCTLVIGSLAAGAGSSRIFAVTVANPVPAGVIQVANTALIGDDAGNSASNNDTTPVIAAPDLRIFKTDGGIGTTPGSTVAYTLSYTNTGNQDATKVVVTEIVPANTSFSIGGSTPGWSCSPNSSAGSTCSFNLGSLLGGNGTGSITFATKVVNPLPLGVMQIANTAVIADDGTNGNDPTPSNNTSSDVTPVTAAPILRAQKSVADVDGKLTMAGDLLEYTIIISNIGNTAATGATLTDAIPVNTTYVPGSTKLNGASIADLDGTMPYLSGEPVNSPGEPSGQINVGESATIVFRVKIDDPLPVSVTQISNQAVVTANGIASLSTNNPSTLTPGDPTAISISKPTAIALASFIATREGGQVVVRWETTAEINTWGFQLYRSADRKRASAALVTSQLIPGQGRGQGGARYSWSDNDTKEGIAYSYWLVETEIAGAANEYGPAIVNMQPAQVTYHLFVPLAVR